MESLIKDVHIYFSELCKDQTNISILLTVGVLLLSIFYYIFKTRGLPPGPVGLPILGYWPFLKNDNLHITLEKLQKKYGDLYSFNYAGALYINMGSAKVIRELHVTNADNFERIHDFSLMHLLFKDGVGFANGEPWKAQRKFAIQMFKETGMVSMKESLGGRMYESIQETVEYLKTKNGNPIDIIQLLTDKCNAIMRRTLFGDSGVTVEEIREINENYTIVMAFMNMSITLHAGNLAKYVILPLQPGYRNALKHYRNMTKILSDIINRHKKSLDEENPPDFIDGFLKERNERLSRGDPSAAYFSDQALIASLIQIVGDGVLSVAGFVGTFLKFVVDHEEVQDKIYSELIEVVGQNRSPTVDDKNKLTYTNALILEVLRMSDGFPMFPSQQCIRETIVRGYRIPKGAITLLNTWAAHHNPDTYENPEKFDPSRFIPKPGKQRAELPVTFGVGKRSCIGEAYAMLQVFLFLTTIIKNFKLSVPKQYNTNTYDLLLSGQMEMCAIPRN